MPSTRWGSRRGKAAAGLFPLTVKGRRGPPRTPHPMAGGGGGNAKVGKPSTTTRGPKFSTTAKWACPESVHLPPFGGMRLGTGNQKTKAEGDKEEKK